MSIEKETHKRTDWAKHNYEEELAMKVAPPWESLRALSHSLADLVPTATVLRMPSEMTGADSESVGGGWVWETDSRGFLDRRLDVWTGFPRATAKEGLKGQQQVHPPNRSLRNKLKPSTRSNAFGVANTGGSS